MHVNLIPFRVQKRDIYISIKRTTIFCARDHKKLFVDILFITWLPHCTYPTTNSFNVVFAHCPCYYYNLMIASEKKYSRNYKHKCWNSFPRGKWGKLDVNSKFQGQKKMRLWSFYTVCGNYSLIPNRKRRKESWLSSSGPFNSTRSTAKCEGLIRGNIS